jgi:hypothetical protein
MLTSHPRMSLVALVSVLLSLAVAIGACGSEATGVKTYTDTDYGYSFEYPAGWTLKVFEVTPETIPDSGGKPTLNTRVSDVAVINHKGADAGGEYLDMVEVKVIYQGQPVEESDLPRIKSNIESASSTFDSDVTDVKRVEPVTEASIGGMIGFKITDSYIKSGVPAVTSLYILFSGAMEYHVLVQASEENWSANQPVFDAILASFKPSMFE